MTLDQTINKIFNAYDLFIKDIPIHYQALLSLGILLFLVWNIYAFLKSGNIILIVILLAALPGTWPATKTLGKIIWVIIKGLLYRIQY